MTEMTTAEGVSVFVAECGHEFLNLRRYTVRQISGATTDCVECGALLLVDSDQFKGADPGVVPAVIQAEEFHKVMRREDAGWPKDGKGTGFVEF